MSLEFDFSLKRDSFHLKVAGELTRGVTGIFGPSGAGKTTLLHLIAGIEKPHRGFLRWRGTPLVDLATGRWTPPHQRGMAVVFQEARLFPHLTVADNLIYGEAHIPYDARRFKLEEVVALLSLGHLLPNRTNTLSGGEAQRVALGRALMSGPHLLLLDEPLASLDKGMQRQILPFLLRIKHEMGVPMIYVSHDLGFMLQLADELLILDQGACLGQGSFLDLIQVPKTAELLGANGLLNVVEVEVKTTDPDCGLLALGLRFAGKPAIGAQDWLAPAWSFQPKDRIQIGLRPEDIALATDTVSQITIQNQIPGVVDRILEQGSRARCLVNVGIPLLVEITTYSVKNLDLQPGKPVYVFFKAQALQCLGPRSFKN